MTRWLLLGLCAAAAVAGPGPAAAQVPANGCWINHTDSFFMRLCFSGGEGKDVMFRWDEAGDEPSARYVGSCRGRLTITDQEDGRLLLEVPRQDEACMQDGQRMRMARRVYDCDVPTADRFSCHETIYYDDGSVFAESANIPFDLAEDP